MSQSIRALKTPLHTGESSRTKVGILGSQELKAYSSSFLSTLPARGRQHEADHSSAGYCTCCRLLTLVKRPPDLYGTASLFDLLFYLINPCPNLEDKHFKLTCSRRL